ncbi:glycerophosphodiester phosphodiesterase [Streptomyces badius]|uniref:GP-PDE domain-containing protein n=1 Tax=Streptomyces badius TaxID=1941 RepID=A0ABQ2TD73_STRBA|nr:glycerophosphodiester phosphodiesterase [Streptomyces badius]GGS63711.1 hypothetical protein GCM10010253_43340 [Streptomyces badius]
MALPDDLPTVTLTGTYTHPDGSPMKGSVSVTPTPGKVVAADSGLTIQGRAKAKFDGNGQVTLTVLATDAPGINPENFTYEVKIAFPDATGDTFFVELPAAAPNVQLPAITPASPADGDYVVITGPEGPEGPAGPAGADGAPGEPGPPGADGSNADAEQYTDDALAAEITRANSAYDPAGSATAARTAAINTAAGDAATKANNAQAAAISAASSDATTKAGNAQAAAVSAAAASAASLYLPKALMTVDAFMAQPGTKVFGHRGAGMVAPEHTEAAYDYAIAHGIQAMELSVNVDSEGELWCLHDLTLDRTTYNTGALNTYPSTGIAQRILTNGRVMLGQGWTDQPMVPLRRMLDKYLGKVVLFLEPKGNDAVVPLQNLLATSYPHAAASVIWKAHVGTSFVWPKNNGFRTWCYVDDGSSDAVLDGKDSLVDYWGVSTSMSSARRQQIVARGKPVFSWPVYRRSQRATLEADGIVGLMSSDPVYVRGTTAQATASRWDQQVKESGGTPQTDYNVDAALKFSDADGWVSINRARGTYGLGRYCPIVPGAGGYRIQIEMKYDQINTGDLNVHGGLYFGKASDDPYEFNTINPSAGYHLILRHNGVLRLYRHVTTQTGGIQLGAGDILTDAPVAGQSMTIQIDVTPTTIEARRLGNPIWTTGPIADASYRGGYFGLSNGSISDTAARPHWRNLIITQL